MCRTTLSAVYNNRKDNIHTDYHTVVYDKRKSAPSPRLHRYVYSTQLMRVGGGVQGLKNHKSIIIEPNFEE